MYAQTKVPNDTEMSTFTPVASQARKKRELVTSPKWLCEGYMQDPETQTQDDGEAQGRVSRWEGEGHCKTLWEKRKAPATVAHFTEDLYMAQGPIRICFVGRKHLPLIAETWQLSEEDHGADSSGLKASREGGSETQKGSSVLHPRLSKDADF